MLVSCTDTVLQSVILNLNALIQGFQPRVVNPNQIEKGMDSKCAHFVMFDPPFSRSVHPLCLLAILHTFHLIVLIKRSQCGEWWVGKTP